MAGDEGKGVPEITDLLQKWHKGDHTAFDKIVNILHEKLKGIVHNRLADFPLMDLQTTELLSQACISLMDQQKIECESRSHFFNMVSQVVLHLLVDEARKRKTEKRGGNYTKTTFLEEHGGINFDADEFLLINDLLEAMQKEDPQLTKIFRMRYIIGLTFEEIAEMEKCSVSSVFRKWNFASTWLLHQMKRGKKDLQS